MVLGIVAAVAVLAVLALAVALLDRVCVALAERKASEYLSQPFGHPATVRVHGTPFLTQALRGRYNQVDVSGGGLRVGDMTGATLTAHLTNIYLPLRELLGGRTTELPCEQVTGQIVLPFGELARAARIPGLELRLVDDQLVASAALPVPGISQLARVSGEAVLSLDNGGSVWLRIRGVSVAGISLPGIVLNQLLPTLNVPIPIPELPYGLRLHELRPSPSGLVVAGSAEAVVFRRLNIRDDRPEV
ncbi:MAG TPA: DUF2993 domain-containing protein [Jatrophihabitans sp.]|uniref:LmeA family phospholipid-binding protein n=1 Tax=Jatrophihabitans sp. TaxID=1932789 RepID=UPI002E067A43|nr:DUF2993 domain-containing protein [Jatrophihabitans sp.]